MSGGSASALRRLFDLVCDLPADARDAALRDAGATPAQSASVLDLLAADATADTRARKPLAALVAGLVDTELTPGDQLGAWRLLRPLGQGGMGAVFLAERADGHFQQQAAIKLIRGFVDDDTAAGFARERQLLAGLQHPKIARLLDGGATPAGHPYLVMEYVDGAPIDAWCREHAATLATRLALVADICRTVHAAHQRLIAHCDLKPSNILVRDEGTPVLLDFGVARTLDPPSPERARDPRSAARTDTSPSSGSTPGRMTPRYASPEQLRGEPPGIPSDIHALGVVLYELLTGVRCERDDNGRVPPPSRAPTDVPWKQRLAGDLDAIVAMACAPDPAHRYGSALALADDIERIAAHRPLQARPQRIGYVAARLLRRRWPAFVVGTVALLLACGFTWRTVLAEQRARLEADTAQRTTDFLVSVFAATDSGATPNTSHTLTARDVLDAGRARIDTELHAEPRIRARLLETLGNAYRHMELGAIAVPLLREAAAIHLDPAIDDPASAARCLGGATNAMANGQFPAADTEAVALQTLELTRRVHAADSRETGYAWVVLALAYNRNAKYSLAAQAGETARSIHERLPDGPGGLHDASIHNLGIILSNRGDFAQARARSEQALAFEAAPVTRSLRLRAYANTLRRMGEGDAAIAALDEALSLAASVHGDDSALPIDYRQQLADLYLDRGDVDRAAALIDRAAAAQRATTAPDSGEAISIAMSQARLAIARGDLATAEQLLRNAYTRRAAQFGSDDPRTHGAAAQLAGVLIARNTADPEARHLLDTAFAGLQARDADPTPAKLHIQLQLAQWHRQAGDLAATRAQLDAIAASLPRIEARDRALHADLVAALADGATAHRNDSLGHAAH